MGPRTHQRSSSSVKTAKAVAGSTGTSTSAVTDRPYGSVTAVAPAGHVALERPELLVPVGLDLIQPGLQAGQGVGAEVEDPQPGVVLHPLVGHHAGGQHDPEV